MTQQDFKGPVLDGPWRGQYVEADLATVPYKNQTGFYCYSALAKGWYWVEKPSAEQKAGD